jgi:hypothetical protein
VPNSLKRPVIDRISIVLRPADGQTLDQIAPFVQLGAHVSIGRGLAVIAGASDRDVVTPAMDTAEFCIDDHIQMAADANRYRWLRDRTRARDLDTDICASADDQCFFGCDLDKNIDDAMRLTRLEELHPCVD